MPDEKTGRLDEELVVQMKGITKVYPNGVAANQGVDFTLRKGEIHALMGENGAGKSTLMKMLFGLEQPTSGEIWVNGEKLNLTAPSVAISHGIGMVHQHFMLVPSLTVAENMVLGMVPKKGLFIDHAKAVEITKEYAERFNLACRARGKGRRHSCRHEAEGRDSQSPCARREDSDSRRADGRSHDAGDDRALQGAHSPQESGLYHRLHLPQAERNHGDHRPADHHAKRPLHGRLQHVRCHKGRHLPADGRARRDT